MCGPDLISRTNGTTQEYYLTDGLGSTTGITDGSGTVTGTYAYDAFGAVRSQTGATTEWSYTGEQNDPTRLEYLRARYYDASTGRFLSQDPVPLLQRYAYANDDPVNLVDPSGLFPGEDRFHQLMEAEKAVQAAAQQILSDAECWKTHMFCPHPALVWKAAKVAVRAVLYVPLEAESIHIYSYYYLSYYALREIERLPRPIGVALMTTPLGAGLLTMEAYGLGGDIALDSAKSFALGNGEQLNDEGAGGYLPGTKAGQILQRWGINTHINYLPGWHADDRKVDWAWGSR